MYRVEETVAAAIAVQLRDGLASNLPALVRAQKRGHGGVTKAAIIGWIIQSTGVAVCLYGYFSTGNPSIVD
jgi:hypothetical protein